jgi:hypothetical protein
MTKTYSTKYNANRAAAAAGMSPGSFEIVAHGDQFTIKALETVGAPASDDDSRDLRPRFLQDAEASDDADVPAFVKKGRPALLDMANAVEAGEKIDTPEPVAAPAKPKAKRAPAKVKGTTSKVELRPDGLRVGSGLAVLVDTVCRPEGATNTELCAAVGWAQCLPAMRKAADKAGVTVRVEKVSGQPARYFGTR